MPTATNSIRQRTSLCLAFLLLVTALLWCLYWFVHARGYWEDDAYIHLEFARSLAQGHGFAFNGIVVSGDTSPLWVFLLAATHALIPNWLTAGKTLTVLSAMFALTGVYAFGRRIAAALLPASMRILFPAALVLLVAVNPYTCYWLYSGMESIAAAGLACWAVVIATRERPTAASFLIGCMFAGLAPLLRPEMFLLTLLLGVPLLDAFRRLRHSAVTFHCMLLAGILLLAVPLGVWSAYSFHTFGYLLPSTVAAKRAGPGDPILIRIIKVYGLGLPIVFLGVVTLPLYLLRTARLFNIVDDPSVALHRIWRRLPLEAWLFLLWTALTIAFYWANHTYIQSRYVLLTAPGLLAVLLATLVRLWPRIARVSIAAALLSSAALSLVVVRPFLRNKEINCRTYAVMALFIRHHVPSTAPVAVYSIGEIAFLSQHPLVDTGGITQPEAIPYLNSPGDSMIHWARGQGAQYAIASSEQSPEAGAVSIFTVDVPFIGWDLHPQRYSESRRVSVWKLPPHPDIVDQADTLAFDKH